MERKEILDEAARIVTGERQNQYGSAENSFALIGGLWGDYLGMYISPRDVALMMILLKVAREKGGKGKADNWIDIAGYAACGGEVATVDTADEKPTDYLRKATAGMRPKYIKFVKTQIEKQTDDKHKPSTCCCIPDDIAKIAKDNEYKRELLRAIFGEDFGRGEYDED
jgi:hypothetical protein